MAENTWRRGLQWLGYGLAGLLGTAVLGMLIPGVSAPLQLAVYDLVYLHVGPWAASETASVVVITLAGAVGIVVPTVMAEYWERGTKAIGRLVTAAVLGVLALIVLEIGAIVFGVEPLLVALLGLALFSLAGLIVLERVGAWPAGAAFVGGLPVLALLVALLGFGLGWGGGYVVVAEPTDAGPAEADFSTVSQVAADLFSDDGGCAVDGAHCLELRGYDRAATAAQFLADHGVRCPHREAAADSGSFLASYEGQTYHVSCVGYGD